MNKGALSFLTLILGASAGSLATYYIAKKKFLAVADKEIESMKEAQKNHDKWLLKQYGIDDTVETKHKETTATITPNTTKPYNRLEEEKGIEERKDYSKITKKYSTDSQSVKRYDELRKNVEKEVASRIVMITPEEFQDSKNNFQTLYYFKLDKVVSDIDNNRVGNYKNIIGDESFWLKEFDGYSKKSIYIRNTSINIDYELILCDERWEDVATPAQRANFLDIGERDDDDRH